MASASETNEVSLLSLTDITIIEKYKGFPSLYNVRSDDHKNRNRAKTDWQSLADATSMSLGEIVYMFIV